MLDILILFGLSIANTSGIIGLMLIASLPALVATFISIIVERKGA
tara:strand:+ start:4442 stop:4576 length:135 start_codon:yes stop_codon:yes gene_type:complete